MVVIRWALLSLILITTASLSVGSTTVVIAAGHSSLSSRVAAQADQDLLALVIQDIDTFWSLAFAAADESYDSPALVPSDGPVWTSCDRADPFADGPLYCGLDQTIYYSPSWFTYIEQQAGDFAWITVLAHEWGHHVQFLIDVEQRAGNTFELQADCLAGAYAQDARTQGLLEPGDVTEAVSVSAASGDPVWLPQDEIGSHGNSDDRITAFMRGYLDGAVGCDLPVDLPAASRTTMASPVGTGTGLAGLLPTEDELPAGLELTDEGARAATEVASGFPDPSDASALLAAWGFLGNAYRTFAAPPGDATSDGTTYLEVSLHAFGTAGDAADALPYYAAGRIEALDHREIRAPQLGDQSTAVGGSIDGSTDATVYTRIGNVLARVSAQAPDDDPLADALVGAEAVVAAADAVRSSIPLADLLPAVADVPAGLVMTQDVQRTLGEVAQNYADPSETERRFTEWDWAGNVARRFEGSNQPSGVVAVYVSLHRFGNVAATTAALDYSFADNVATTGATEIHVSASLGDPARGLATTTAAGDEATVYTQQGTLLIRATVVSVGGDPTDEAVRITDLVALNAGILVTSSGAPSQATSATAPPQATTGAGCEGATAWWLATLQRLTEAEGLLTAANDDYLRPYPDYDRIEESGAYVATLALQQQADTAPPSATELQTEAVAHLELIADLLTTGAYIYEGFAGEAFLGPARSYYNQLVTKYIATWPDLRGHIDAFLQTCQPSPA